MHPSGELRASVVYNQHFRREDMKEITVEYQYFEVISI